MWVWTSVYSHMVIPSPPEFLHSMRIEWNALCRLRQKSVGLNEAIWRRLSAHRIWLVSCYCFNVPFYIVPFSHFAIVLFYHFTLSPVYNVYHFTILSVCYQPLYHFTILPFCNFAILHFYHLAKFAPLPFCHFKTIPVYHFCHFSLLPFSH